VKASGRKKREIPEGVFQKCPGCEGTIYQGAIAENMHTCPECSYHFRISPAERIKCQFDPDSFEELYGDIESGDPLGFRAEKAYAEKLLEDQRKTGSSEAVTVGVGRIEGRLVATALMDFNFVGGSMGSVVGERITRCVEMAAERGLPLVTFSASGGARMQESALSLAQMVKTASAVARFKSLGGLHISVMTDPTTGGVLASFASLGDVLVAEPGALIGFAGARVIKETIKQELPEGFQTAEFLLEHGFLDFVVPRKKLKDRLAAVMDFLLGPAAQPDTTAAAQA